MAWVGFLIASLVLSMPARAGVPQVIHPTTGHSIGWSDPSHVPAIFDQGPLGKLSNAQARALIEAMMGVWEEVPTSNVAFAPQGTLDRDVTADNVADYIDGTVCSDDFPAVIPSMVRGESPIIFDNDGRIIDLLAGQGASHKIVGKAAMRCYKGTLANPTEATQAFAVFNGLFIDGKPDPDDLDINVYAGIILHELGHFLGLHHSMVNETLFEELLTGSTARNDARFLPVMYPLVLHDSIASTVLKPDDVAAISALYPTKDAATKLSSITGAVVDTGRNGFRGANVGARRQDDPLCQAVSTISGRFCTALVDDGGHASLLGDACNGTASNRGMFRVDGLSAGKYTVEVSELTTFGDARTNMFPKTGDVTLPGPAEFYSANDTERDDVHDKTVVTVNAGQTLADINIQLNTTVANTQSVQKSIPLDGLARHNDSACVTDPVDYNALIATVDANPDTNLTSKSDLQKINAGTGGGGCSLDAIQRGSTSNGNVGIVCVLGFAGMYVMVRYSRRKSWIVCCVMLSSVVPLSSQASSMLPTTPQELVTLAGKAFVGTCESVVQRIDQRGLSIYEVRYRVQRMMKGAPQARVIFRVVTSMLGDGELAGAAQPFTVGSQDVLFLYPESAWGYTSPVAGAQGRFHITHDATGQAIVRNPFAGAQQTSNVTALRTMPLPQLLERFQQVKAGNSRLNVARQTPRQCDSQPRGP